MNATITCKFKIDTDPSSQSLLSETMKAFRDACDFASEHVWLTHDLVRRSLNNDLYRALRDMFGMKAQMAQSVLIAVIARYKAVLETLGCFELVEFKRPQLDLVWNRDYSITKDGCFSINTLRGRIRAPFHTDGFEKYLDPALSPRFGTAKLVYKHGCFFMHVPVTVTVPDGPSVSDITNVVGVDRGIRFLAATYDSKHRTTFYSGKDIAGKRAHYKELRRGLQQIGTPSSRRRLKAIGERENRYVQDVDHCIAKALVTNNPKGTLFVLEDLTGIRAVTERVKGSHRYETVSWPFYDLEMKLKYKAALYGHRVINVDPRNTSRTCPMCGHVHKQNRDKAHHVFVCRSCGYTSNDDRSAAMNLQRMGIEYLVQSQPGIS